MRTRSLLLAGVGVLAVATAPESYGQIRTEGAPGSPGSAVSPSQIPESQRLRPSAPTQGLQTPPSQLPTAQRLQAETQVPRQSVLLRQGTSDERALAVYERPLTDFDPIGVQVGSFYVFPSVDTGVEYNDNIYATSPKTGDGIFLLSPKLAVRSNLEQDQLNLDISSASGFFLDKNSENYSDYQGALNGRYYLTPTVVAFARAGAAHLHEARTSPNVLSPTEPTEYNDYRLFAGLAQTGLELQLQGDVFYERLRFQSVALPSGGQASNGFRDYDQIVTTGRVGYEFSRQLLGFVRGSYNTRTYAQLQSGGLSRDSDGYTGVVGVDLDLNSIVVAELFGGFLRQNYEDPRLTATSGPTFGLNAVWNPTANASVLFDVIRSVDETTLTGSSGIETTTISLGAQYQFLPNLQGRVDYLHSFLDFTGTAFSDDVDTVSASAKYYLGRNLILTPVLSYVDRHSNRLSASFDQFRALLAVTVQY